MEGDNKRKIYEIGYHLVPTLDETKISAEVENLRKGIEERGGAIISEEAPKERTLAYTISKKIESKNVKFSKAFFGWIKFEIDSDKAVELDEYLKNNLSVLRYILINTVRENTVIGKVVKKSDKDNDKKKESGPVVEAELDKKIDELVTDSES